MPKTRYTADQKAEAIALSQDVGVTEASRQLDIHETTIYRWRTEAGVPPSDPQKTADAIAANAQRVQRTWGDFREQEALGAGASALKIRNLISTTIDERAGRGLKDLCIAYGIMIDKAEMLSGQATQRIEVWAQSELDRELRSLVTQMEDSIRERGSATP